MELSSLWRFVSEMKTNYDSSTDYSLNETKAAIARGASDACLQILNYISELMEE